MSNATATYEWLPDIEFEIVDPSSGRICRQPRCGRPAAAVFSRQRRTSRGLKKYSWYCCDDPEHLYGRRMRDGIIERQYMVDSHEWEIARTAMLDEPHSEPSR